MQKSNQNKKKIIIGVTGSFGSGKTTVSSILKSCGAYVIDADKIAHSLISPGTQAYKKIVKLFGKEILAKNKAIERRKLSRIVFSDKEKLARLNAIVHPEVIKRIKNKIKSAKNKIIVLDVPLLVESGMKKIVDRLIVVDIPKEKQLERIRAKTGLSKAEIIKRIKAQVSLSDKVRFADFVIDNSVSKNETKKQARRIYKELITRREALTDSIHPSSKQ